MSQERKNIFVGEIATHYDADSTGVFDPAVVTTTVDFLAELAGDGRALEFAIGTGRIGLPLSERGVPVSGIELSSDMAAQLKKKPGSGAIDVTIGDMTSTRVDGTFRLVYLVFNTIGNLLSQDEQVDCFCNAAAHLEPGGCFVIEVIVPPLRRLPPGESSLVFTLTPQRVGYDEIDVAQQLGVSHHIWFREDGPKKFSTPWRLVWPAELDLMARIAGMRLRERWQDWDRSPFTGESMKHVSVWEKTRD
ncbi:MAG TPA: class I SAM-dependent methyltransferase [Acidimicrobiales bacterium]|nr:class I SAM-dependent methyltransferase [Acidimicrobiales bacterium]